MTIPHPIPPRDGADDGAGGGAQGAATPNLPALIAALPGDDTRAPQTGFTRERQAEFLRALADGGSARRAAKRVGVSHQSAYRARRACREFARAWDVALLSARSRAEEVLADRALDGVEEAVFYHGEEVATRRRYDSRLLLAHLARLDRLAERADLAALADGFEAVLDAFARGEPLAPAPAAPAPEKSGVEKGDFSSPGQCNMRSMSPPETAEPEDDRYADHVELHTMPVIEDFAADALWAGRMIEEPDDGGPTWQDKVDEMLAHRPDDAPPFEALIETDNSHGTFGELRDCIYEQVFAYNWNREEWWTLDHKGVSRPELSIREYDNTRWVPPARYATGAAAGATGTTSGWQPPAPRKPGAGASY